MLNMKLRTVATLSLVLLLAACGTIKIDIDTRVRDLEDFSHTIEITATDQLALMIEGSLRDQSAEDSIQFDFATENGVLTATSSHRFTGEAAKAELEKQDDTSIVNTFVFGLTATETADGVLYRASYKVNDIADFGDDPASDSETDPFGIGNDIEESMKGLLEGMMLFNWKVEMPGEIVDSNADVVTGSSATFSLSTSELQGTVEIWVESLVKNSSSGSCNAE